MHYKYFLYMLFTFFIPLHAKESKDPDVPKLHKNINSIMTTLNGQNEQMKTTAKTVDDNNKTIKNAVKLIQQSSTNNVKAFSVTQDSITGVTDNINQKVLLLLSKMNGIQSCVETDFNQIFLIGDLILDKLNILLGCEINLNDLAGFTSKLDTLCNLIEAGCSCNEKTVSKIDYLTTLVNIDLAIDAIVLNKITDIEQLLDDNIAQEAISLEKIFSKVDQLATNVAIGLSNLDNAINTEIVLDELILNKVIDLENALEDNIAQEAISLEKIFSKVDQLATNVAVGLSDLGDAINTGIVLDEIILNKMTDLENALEDNIAQEAISLEKIFSKVDQLATTVSVGLSNLESAINTDLVIDELILNKVNQLEIIINESFEELEECLDCDQLILNQKQLLSKVDKLEDTVTTGFTTIENALNNVCPCITVVIKQADIGSGDIYQIEASGHYKVGEPLTFDTGHAITILADNVTLDLNGYTIRCASDDGVCIAVNGATQTTIKNGNLFGGRGILVGNARALQISDVSACANQVYAFRIVNTSDINVHHCAALRSDNRGFDINLCNNVIMRSCIAQDNSGDGVRCRSSQNVQIIKNMIEGNGNNGIVINTLCANVHTIGNQILGNIGTGLNDQGASEATHANNLSSGNGTQYHGVSSVTLSSASSYWKNVRG